MNWERLKFERPFGLILLTTAVFCLLVTITTLPAFLGVKAKKIVEKTSNLTEPQLEFIKPDQEKTKLAVSQLGKTTKDLKDTLSEFKRTGNAKLVADIQSFSKNRKAHLIETMHRDPKQTFAFILSEAERNELLALAPENAETLVTIKGSLERFSTPTFLMNN